MRQAEAAGADAEEELLDEEPLSDELLEAACVELDDVERLSVR